MAHPNPLVECLAQHAREEPARVALVRGGSSVHYASLLERAERAGGELRRASADERSVVGVACTDEIEHLVWTIAAGIVGAASVAIPVHASAEERDATARVCGVTHVALDDAVRDLGAASRPLSVRGALLFATSGTTGAPKVVVQGAGAIVRQAPRHVDAPDERFACLASVEHNFARRHRLYVLARGATNVFVEGGARGAVGAADAFTTLHVTAFQAQELLTVDGAAALRGKLLKLGGSHVHGALRERLRREITPRVRFGYGTTETGAIGFTEPDDADAGESVGRALPGLEVRVLDEGGAPVPTGEPGAIAVRSDGLFEGYLDRPELTAQRLVDGWFQTGDLGRLDAAGRLHLVGRADDMFVFNSMNVHPQDLEAQVREHPGVADVVVVPKTSPVHGDVPVALVVAAGGEALDLRALKRYVRDRAGLRCPRQFLLIEEVPRTEAGKVDRAAARGLVEGAAAR
ncbi:MAG: fatty acid--CoA ligase family protein [Planctomycetota bacterium]